MRISETIARNLREYRLSAGLSQEKLAQKARVTARYISSLENGAHNINLETLERLAQGLGVPPSELLIDHGASGSKAKRARIKELQYAIQKGKDAIELLQSQIARLERLSS